jgi:hypothetical protein
VSGTRVLWLIEITYLTSGDKFNASVQDATTELGTTKNRSSSSSIDWAIVGTMGALFGVVSKLLQKDGLQQPHAAVVQNSRSRHAKERVASTLFQTLHRLAKTGAGYKCLADLTTLHDCLPCLWSIEDVFCKFGAYSVLNALLSGTNKDKPNAIRHGIRIRE